MIKCCWSKSSIVCSLRNKLHTIQLTVDGSTCATCQRWCSDAPGKYLRCSNGNYKQHNQSNQHHHNENNACVMIYWKREQKLLWKHAQLDAKMLLLIMITCCCCDHHSSFKRMSFGVFHWLICMNERAKRCFVTATGVVMCNYYWSRRSNIRRWRSENVSESNLNTIAQPKQASSNKTPIEIVLAASELLLSAKVSSSFASRDYKDSCLPASHSLCLASFAA